MKAFRAALENRDRQAVTKLLAEDVVFRSPIVFAPYSGRKTVVLLLEHVAQVLEDWHCVRELSNEETADHALVFKARVGTREVEGCDFLHLNDEGLIDEMFVMVRPLSAAHALQEAMTARLEAGNASAAAA
jgi:hypothetical protein